MTARARRAARAAGLGLLALAVLWLLEAQYHFLPGASRRRPLAHRELAMEFLGQHLARTCPGKRAVVLSNPFSSRSGQPAEVYAFEKAGLQGLKRGLGNAVRIEAVVFPELKSEAAANPRAVFINPTTTTPLSYLVAEDSFDKVASAYPQAEILVSLIGLPVNISRSPLWKNDNPAKLALLLPDLRIIGNHAAIREAFRTRKIAGIVVNKPGSPPETQPLRADEQAEFDRRFLLVTPDNIDRIVQAYPRLF